MRVTLIGAILILIGAACAGDPPVVSTATPTETPIVVAAVVDTPTATAIPSTSTPILGISPTPITGILDPSNIQLGLIPTPTPSPIPPTNTPIPPTSTPIPPTSTPSPIPSTATAIPPTNTPVPPTNTPTPAPTATPLPVFAQGEISVDIILPVAPNGLSGYTLDVIIGSHVNLKGATSNLPLFSINGNRLSGVDLNDVVGIGATDFILATILLEAVQPGSGPIEISVVRFDDDEGFPIIIQFDPGFIEVLP